MADKTRLVVAVLRIDRMAGWDAHLAQKTLTIGVYLRFTLRLSDLSPFILGERRALCAAWSSISHTLGARRALCASYPRLSPGLSPGPRHRCTDVAAYMSSTGPCRMVYTQGGRVEYIQQGVLYPPWYRAYTPGYLPFSHTRHIHRVSPLLPYPGIHHPIPPYTTRVYTGVYPLTTRVCTGCTLSPPGYFLTGTTNPGLLAA